MLYNGTAIITCMIRSRCSYSISLTDRERILYLQKKVEAINVYLDHAIPRSLISQEADFALLYWLLLCCKYPCSVGSEQYQKKRKKKYIQGRSQGKALVQKICCIFAEDVGKQNYSEWTKQEVSNRKRNAGFFEAVKLSIHSQCKNNFVFKIRSMTKEKQIVL